MTFGVMPLSAVPFGIMAEETGTPNALLLSGVLLTVFTVILRSPIRGSATSHSRAGGVGLVDPASSVHCTLLSLSYPVDAHKGVHRRGTGQAIRVGSRIVECRYPR